MNIIAERDPVSDFSQDSSRDGLGAPRTGRRLSDKILVAFHQACDLGDLEVSEQLLQILEMMMTRRPLPVDGNRRKSIESLVAAYERLWYLRHPER